MSKSIISVKNLGKKYSIGEKQSFYTLRDTVAGLFSGKKKKEDDFWALKDVNFDIKQGESVGIIGRNGAGKSTLLKILSQITPPTTGKIMMRGRVASLLEVGTGFHQELTGRENIFLNGAILGMSREEVRKKFDEIVAFSEVEKFIDMPVKHYSSGMYMRLAFAVAAHLESEILIVDEVLAVGDAQFQKKCLGKMDDVAKKEGRTVLFVSHNMGAVKNLCSRAILLASGKIEYIGSVEKATNIHLFSYGNNEQRIVINKKFKNIYIKSIKVNGPSGWNVPFKEDVELEVEIYSTGENCNFRFGLGLNNALGERLFTVHGKTVKLKNGVGTVIVKFKNLLSPGTYSISVGAANYFYLPDIAVLNVESISKKGEQYFELNYGYFNVISSITYE